MHQKIGNFHYFFQFCGFSIYSKNKRIQKFLLISSSLWLLFPTTCILLGQFVFGAFPPGLYNKIPPITLFLNWFNYIIRFASHTICLLESQVKKCYEEEILKEIKSIDRTLLKYFRITPKHKFKKFINILIFSYTIVLLGYLTSIFVSHPIKAFWFLSFPTYTMLFIFDLQIILHVILIINRISSLRKCLKISGGNKFSLNLIQDMYLQLHDLSKIICMRFKFSFLIRIFVLYIQFTCSVYWIFEAKVVKHIKELNIFRE